VPSGSTDQTIGVRPTGVKVQPILETSSLERSYSGVVVVNGVSISVEPGKITGLIGPNGAGKSTTLAMLAGTTSPTGGRIFYQGRDVTSMQAYERARAGLVRTFQLSSEFKRMTVLENLMSAVPGHPGDSLERQSC
jgi:ABC-type branched-subunit amino acid transport system ATPase component